MSIVLERFNKIQADISEHTANLKNFTKKGKILTDVNLKKVLSQTTKILNVFWVDQIYVLQGPIT